MADLKRVYAAVDEQTALSELDSFDENGAVNILRKAHRAVPRGCISVNGKHYFIICLNFFI